VLSDPRWGEALAKLPDYLGSHIRIGLAALALGLACALPLALAVRRRPLARRWLLGLASVAQTIPGLALLALFFPVLLALSAVAERWLSVGISAFGFLPALLALALYSLLPVLRNTLTGLDGLDPVLGEAADAVGMTARQKLWRIELPLALPVIMAGIRTAAVWVIGTATLATPIGQTSLGNYIFAGLQTQNWISVVVGCVAAAVLALAVDRLLGLVETALQRRSGGRLTVALAGVLVLIVAAWPFAAGRGGDSYVIGAKTFAEQYVLAALLGDRLAAAGLASRPREGLGSNVAFAALAADEVDLYVDYSGTLWRSQLQHGETPPREALLVALREELAQRRVTLLGALGFENAYALVMPRARAAALGIRSIADLAGKAGDLVIAGDYEFFARPEWAALRATYGLGFRRERQMQPDFMYAALKAGEVDVIAGYTSDGQIAADDLVVLDDPRRIIPPYDAVLLLAPRRAGDERLKAALRPLLGRIDVDHMRQANLRAAGRGGEASPAAVARWLWQATGR
jgi:osmoprotectant transport system permease protein